jgi:alkylation response protein AidB-like acyl-CoA dehydrogenase
MSVALGLIEHKHVIRTVGPTVPPSILDLLRKSGEDSASTGQPDKVALDALRKSGLLAIPVPTEYGGAGGDAASLNWLVEQVATVNPSAAIMLFQHFAVTARIAEWGSDEQKADLLPALASGKCWAASAWSETGAGAAKKKLATTGTRLDDGRWRLHGAKSFTTSAGVADLYLVLVQTSVDEGEERVYGSAGQTFFLVRRENPGLVADVGLDLVGMRGSATGFVTLAECQVSDSDRLGPVGHAATIIAGVRESGATLGSVSVGIAQAAVDAARAHLDKLGASMAEAKRCQLVNFATIVEAARALVVRASHGMSANPGIVTLQSKLYASIAAEQVCLEIARNLGSSGYAVEHQLNRLLGDARAVALMGPTNDLCRELVAGSWDR